MEGRVVRHLDRAREGAARRQSRRGRAHPRRRRGRPPLLARRRSRPARQRQAPSGAPACARRVGRAHAVARARLPRRPRRGDCRAGRSRGGDAVRPAASFAGRSRPVAGRSVRVRRRAADAPLVGARSCRSRGRWRRCDARLTRPRSSGSARRRESRPGRRTPLPDAVRDRRRRAARGGRVDRQSRGESATPSSLRSATSVGAQSRRRIPTPARSTWTRSGRSLPIAASARDAPSHCRSACTPPSSSRAVSASAMQCGRRGCAVQA